MISREVRENINYSSLSKEKDKEEWSRICNGEESIKREKELGKMAAFREWESSWPHKHRNANLRHRAAADPDVWNAASYYIDKKTGRQKMSLKSTPSNLHRHLKRAQSSVAMQIRSEHIGLKSYLYRRKVPGVNNQSCPCGYPSENVKHTVMACPLKVRGRTDVWRKAKNRSFEAMISNPEDLGRITQWILDQGWFDQFRLAEVVEKVIQER
ncbi:hypothetical protein EV44_g3676 [Erysiphe necator]|uniref:Reverse transcriptase n=1 Tax=Uncinula necator TaxID=52586 RepID=A0A0B1P827_UNCNE|nr:hypothetical protein EV44_g3676 [Erysiphe necator]